MKKGLERLAGGAVNIASNVLLGAGALEYVQGLSEAGESGYTTGLVGVATGLCIYGLNKFGAIDKTRSIISNLSKKAKGKFSTAAKVVGLTAYLATAGLVGYNTGKNIFNDILGKEEVSPIPTPVPVYTIKGLPMPNNDLIKGQTLASRHTIKGKFQRTYRWDALFDKVESKYKIEKGLLAGLCMREGYGNPLQLNSSGDGGAGMIQMQPGMAQHYGLKTYGKSKTLGRDINHGKKLKKLLGEINYDYPEAAKYDERFNPRKNIDAAGRMISEYYKKYGNWDKAISAYNVGQKKSSKVPVKTNHVKHVREFQNFYNKNDKVNHK